MLKFCLTPIFTKDISICESLPIDLYDQSGNCVSIHIIHLMLLPDVPYNISSFPPQFINSMSHRKPIIVPVTECQFLSSLFLAQYYFPHLEALNKFLIPLGPPVQLATFPLSLAFLMSLFPFKLNFQSSINYYLSSLVAHPLTSLQLRR